MDKNVEYCCKNCNKIVDIGVIIYSHDEYSCDANCPECHAPIPSDDQDKILNDEVTDYVSSKIDYAHDYLKDR